MSHKHKTPSRLRAALVGAAIGAGLSAYRSQQQRRNPLHSPAQQRINRGLDRALNHARQKHSLPLNPEAKYIIFSDHHRGVRDGADDFQPCEMTYLSALEYYYQNGYTLILLGDVEELWENPIMPVMQAYASVFISEQRFYPNRYLRFVGNHDNAWNIPAFVKLFLDPLYPGLRVQESLVLEYSDGPLSGEIFLTHGHQGTLDSDTFAKVPPLVLPFYRRVQNATGIGHTTPSQDAYLRGEHDSQMYHWASQKSRLILIAGHTHRPVWSSLTHLDQLYIDLYALRLRKSQLDPQEYEKELQRLLAAIQRRMRKDPPVNDILKTVPCYFNTGCCRFADGDITGLEITGQSISLVKWDARSLQRQEPISMYLADLFSFL